MELHFYSVLFGYVYFGVFLHQIGTNPAQKYFRIALAFCTNSCRII